MLRSLLSFVFIFIFPTINCLLSPVSCLNSFDSFVANKSETNIHALILARGGSKGIPRKNLKKLNGVSLLGRTLLTLNKSGLFTEVWVSTDDEEIAIEARSYSALVHIRPESLARDNTSSLESVKEFLQKYKYIKKLALFQCTSVFLKIQYIKEAFENFLASECVFSVTKSYKLRWEIYDTKRGLVQPINFNLTARPRRQDWVGEYYENGMFYFADRHLIMDMNAFQNIYCKIVVISENDDLEIDTESNFKYAKYLLKKL